MKLIICGSPGAGKSTQCRRLSEATGLPHLSTGARLRQEIAQGTELGKAAEQIVNSGGFFDDDFTLTMVKGWLGEDQYSGGVLIDGFPRTLPQAQGFNDYQAALLIEVSPQTIEARLTKRAEQSGRSDDNASVRQARLKRFEEQTRPMFDHFESVGKLRRVSGEGTVEAVHERLVAVIEGLRRC